MEIKVAARQIESERGALCSLVYYLTVELAESPQFCLERYGVRIRDQNGSSACTAPLTSSAMEIDELITLLVDNCVTPVTLQDVVADWALSRTLSPA